MSNEPPEYEVHCGWTWPNTLLVIVCFVFAAILLAPGGPLYMRVLGGLFFGGGGLMMAVMALSRAVVLRVDEKGVLLGGMPPGNRATTTVVPWSEIEAIVLWRQRAPFTFRSLYVGVQRHPGLPPLPGLAGSRFLRTANRCLVHVVPADVVMASRAMTLWNLDEDRLARAVAHFAPHVAMVDTRLSR
ncbi:hypothetical protein ACFXKC_55990 [Streptomyces sp. NPDC059340]|uniref:hypothetical protein n=1 Tax=Streptomyces sp. NPDC059340 TaxID=3346806 RepID=UPI0036815143